MFAPGPINPFAALQSLQISEGIIELEACCAALMNAEPNGQLFEAASLVRSLPSLEHVSGRTKIFVGFREGLNGWTRTSVSESLCGQRDSHVCSRSVCLAAEQTWRKKERSA